MYVPMDYVFGWSLCACVCSADEIYLTGVYVGYAHSQLQAVILQVLGVGGGAVWERGVGDEVIITYCWFICVLSNTNIAII